MLVLGVVLSATAGTAAPRQAQDQDGAVGEEGGAQDHAVQFQSLDPDTGAYHFGYDTGSLQHQSFREETRTKEGGVHGRYGYVDAGVLRITEYTADQSGYRCRQSIRYLVHPNNGAFVTAEEPGIIPVTSKIPQDQELAKWDPNTDTHETDFTYSQRPRQKMLKIDHGNMDEWSYGRAKATKLSRKSWRPSETKSFNQGALPARILGKKVAGHYRDFTSEPALGGTAAVTSWDSAHKAQLHDGEILRMVPRSLNKQEGQLRPIIGGTLVWPTTENGQQVVWHQF